MQEALQVTQPGDSVVIQAKSRPSQVQRLSLMAFSSSHLSQQTVESFTIRFETKIYILFVSDGHLGSLAVTEAIQHPDMIQHVSTVGNWATSSDEAGLTESRRLPTRRLVDASWYNAQQLLHH